MGWAAKASKAASPSAVPKTAPIPPKLPTRPLLLGPGSSISTWAVPPAQYPHTSPLLPSFASTTGDQLETSAGATPRGSVLGSRERLLKHPETHRDGNAVIFVKLEGQAAKKVSWRHAESRHEDARMRPPKPPSKPTHSPVPSIVQQSQLFVPPCHLLRIMSRILAPNPEDHEEIEQRTCVSPVSHTEAFILMINEASFLVPRPLSLTMRLAHHHPLSAFFTRLACSFPICPAILGIPPRAIPGPTIQNTLAWQCRNRSWSDPGTIRVSRPQPSDHPSTQILVKAPHPRMFCCPPPNFPPIRDLVLSLAIQGLAAPVLCDGATPPRPLLFLPQDQTFWKPPPLGPDACGVKV